MRKKLVAVLVTSLFASGTAWAQDNPFGSFVWSGSLTVGGRGTSTDGGTRNGAFGGPYATTGTTITPFTGPADEAKAQEYQDTQSGVIGVIDLIGANRGYYLRGFAENMGRDDQYINVLGGGYGMFKGQFYSDRMPHNLSFNALTPLAGAGTGLQTNPALPYPQAYNPGQWNTFNYSLQRNTIGGNVEVSANTPFYVRADYNEVTTTGTRPGSAQLGTGSGNGLIELGMPTEYKTQNSTLEAGYATKAWNVKFAFLDSKFSNSTPTTQWTNFYMRSALDWQLPAPDNELQKWSLNGMVRDLPWDSQLLVRVTQSKLTNNFGVTSGSLKPTGSQTPPTGVGTLVTQPSASTFDGNVETTTATVSWNATPMKGLDTRIYYEYYDKANKSTSIGYNWGGLGSAASTCPDPIPPSTTNNWSASPTRFCIAPLEAAENFGYTKNTYGIDASYRIDARQKILGQYTYTNIDRELEPADNSRIQRFWIEYRNTKWADWSGRLRYQYLQQRSDLDPSVTNNSSGQTSANVPYYFTAYDVNNFDQNMVRLNLDWTPLPMTSVSFGATWRGTDYKGNYYGRTDDRTQLYDLSVSYGDPDKFRVSLIGNWSEVKFNQMYRNTGSSTNPPVPNLGPLPDGGSNSLNFNWGTKNTQGNWLVALMADWVPLDNLRLTSSLSYQETNGGVDFWSSNYEAAGGFNGGPLVNYVTDNTKLTRFQLKGEYAFNKNWSFTAGYWYNKYDYTDDQMRGYQGYYPYFQSLNTSATTTNYSWWSGAFANPSYTQNIFYLTVAYRFGN